MKTHVKPDAVEASAVDPTTSPVAAPVQAAKDRVLIFDTTMRDGEQSPGANMSIDEKRRIGALLDEMGVDIIEAGFPIASEGDFESVKAVSELVRRASVCGLARASTRDIDRAAAALEKAHNPRIHTFISTSPLHMKYKLQLEPAQVLEKIHASVSRARSLCDNVQWSPEDGTRTEHDFLVESVETAIAAGAQTINIPDTVGYTIPGESAEIIAMLKQRVRGIDDVVISTHCHNDLGMAVANALAAVQAGARQVECTINGLGERAGNAALEEIVMALKVRADRMPYDSGVDAAYLTRASKLVSTVTGFPVQYNKAIVGKNAFAHESGIHQDGMLKHAGTYEIMTPESVGLTESNLVMGKHSGRHAFKQKLADLGYEIGDNAVEDAFVRFKALADAKKDVYDADIIALVEDAATAAAHDRIKLTSMRVVCGTESPQSADLVLDIDGVRHEVSASGDGPVDAAFNCVKKLAPHEGKLELYQVHAVTKGTDAQAEVSVRLNENGHISMGHAAHTDTLVASVRAYVNALNKLALRREKSAPSASLT